MIGTFSEDESVAWPSYVDFLSTFAILMILFAGYMAFLLTNGVRDTAFLSDKENFDAAPIAGVSVDEGRRQVLVNLSDLITFDTGCPGKSTCARMEEADKQRLREFSTMIAGRFPNASRISVQGRADTQHGSNDYTNMEVAGKRAMEVFKDLNDCKTCSEKFRSKLEIANVGDKGALGIGPTYRTVFLILDYSQDEPE